MKIKKQQIPEGFSESDIRIESSVCTGEKTIGFYDSTERRLKYAELVRSEGDVVSFYARYGLKFDK